MKRKLNKRSVALLVSLAVILTAAVGVTLAYIFTNTDAEMCPTKKSNLFSAVYHAKNQTLEYKASYKKYLGCSGLPHPSYFISSSYTRCILPQPDLHP